MATGKSTLVSRKYKARYSGDSVFLLEWRDLWFAVLGKEIIQRFGEQILNSRVMLGREKPQLPFDFRRKVASDVAFPFPSRPKMKSPRFRRRGKFGGRLYCTRVARRCRWPRNAKHGLP